MNRSRRYLQLDVFSSEPLLGNPLAVVLDADGIADETMAAFARWTNLSETTFILAATDARADYRVRIFTPTGELPFAGHPTLGSCYAWLQGGGKPRRDDVVVQQCEVGLINVHREGDRLAFEAPPLRRGGPLDDPSLDLVARALSIPRDQIIDHQWADNGPGWRVVMLASADRVLALSPDAVAMRDLKLGIVGAWPPGSECRFEVRALIGTSGSFYEDPVTGSLNAGIGQWLFGNGMVAGDYVASQGTVLGRRGRVHVGRVADGKILVGGAVTGCIVGQVSIPDNAS